MKKRPLSPALFNFVFTWKMRFSDFSNSYADSPKQTLSWKRRLSAFNLAFLMFFTSAPVYLFDDGFFNFSDSSHALEQAYAQESDCNSCEVYVYEEEQEGRCEKLYRPAPEDFYFCETSDSEFADLELIYISYDSNVYYNPDTGEETEEFFAVPVRFEDEYGELIEVDPSLTTSDKQDYRYESAAGESMNFFPEVIDEYTPFLLSYQDYEVRFTLSKDEEVTLREVEDLEFIDAFDGLEERPLAAIYEIDGDTSFRVISSDIGIKSEFILYTLPETNIFTYELKLTDMTAYLSQETTEVLLFSTNEEDAEDPVAVIPEGLMWDASYEGAFSADIAYELERVEEGRYLLSLVVCEYYLNCESRVFPITVDPTITWQGTFASRADGRGFTTTFVRSGTNYRTLTGSAAVMPMGRGREGVSRSFVRGDNLNATIRGRSVTAATLHLHQRNVASYTRNVNVGIHRVLCPTGSQTNAYGSMTWNNQPSHQSASIATRRTGTVDWAHSFNVLSWAQGVANGNFTGRGFVVRAVDESLNQYAQFYGASAATASRRPRIVITTVNPPTAPTSITLSNNPWAPGMTLPVLRWSGVTSTRAITRFEYRITNANICQTEGTHSSGTVVKAFDQAPFLTAAQGTGGFSLPISNLAHGCYRVAVRAVDNTGAAGPVTSISLHVDRQAPTFTGLNLNPNNTSATNFSTLSPAITWTNVADTPWCNATRITVEGFVRRPDGTTGPVRNIINNRFPARTGLGAGNTLDRRELFRPDMLPGRSQAHTVVVRARDRAGNVREQSFQYFYDSSNLSLGDAAFTHSPASGWHNTPTLPDITWQGLSHTDRLGNNLSLNRRVQVSFQSQGGTQSAFYNLSPLSQSATGTNEVPEQITNLMRDLPDGRHTIRLRAINEHGRISPSVVTLPFWLDTTAPVLGLTLSSQTKGDVLASSTQNTTYTNAPKVSGNLWLNAFIDEHRDASGFDLTAESSSMTIEGVNVVHTSQVPLQSINFNYSLNTRALSGDGIYRITFTGQDRAKNVSEPATLYFEVQNLLAAPVITPYLPGGTVNDEGEFDLRWQFVTGYGVRSGMQWALATKDCDTNDLDTLTWTTINDSANEGTFTVNTPRDDNNNPLPGTFTLFARALDNNDNPGNIFTLNLQVSPEDRPKELPLEGATPINFSARDRLDYRTHFYWESAEMRPYGVLYEILYSRVENAPTHLWNVIATSLDQNTFASPNFNYSQDFFYKVRPVKLVERDEQTIRYVGKPSNVATSRAADENEFSKRLGIQDYWQYEQIDTPIGTAQVEKSQGNLVYTMIDRYLENDTMLQCGITRVHNSQSSLIFSFGQGTDFSYNVELLRQQSGQSYVFKDATGTLRTFVWSDFHNTYFTRDSMRIRMEKFEDPKQVRVRTNFGTANNPHEYAYILVGYIVTSHRQREYWFSQGGQLLYITDTPLQLHAELKEGQSYFIANHDVPNLTFTYCAYTGLLRSATSRGIRSMHFAHNAERLIEAVWLPDESVISYYYDSGKRLVEVRQHENIILEADFLSGNLPANHTDDIYHTYTWQPLGFFARLGITQERHFKTGINGIPREVGVQTPTTTISYTRDRNDEMLVKVTSSSDVLGNRTDIAYSRAGAVTTTLTERTPYGLSSPNTATRSTLCGLGHPVLTETGTASDVASGNGQRTAQTWQNHLPMTTTEVAEYHELIDGVVHIRTTPRVTTTSYNALQLPTVTVDCSGFTVVKSYTDTGINEEKVTHEAAYYYCCCGDDHYLLYEEWFEFDDCGGMKSHADVTYETFAEQEFCNYTGNILNTTTHLQAFHNGEKCGPAVLQNETIFTYDVHNNLIRTASTNHGTPSVTTEKSKEYDGLGRLLFQSEGTVVNGQLTGVMSTRYNFDRQGRLVGSITIEPSGEQRHDTVTYDRDGTVKSQTCALGITVTSTHDIAGRVTSSTAHVPGRESQTATIEYGFATIENLKTAEGTRRLENVQVTTTTDAAGLKAREYVDALGNVVRTSAQGINTDSVFTADGRTFAVITLPESLERSEADISLSLYDKNGNQTHVVKYPEIVSNAFRVGATSIVTSQTFDGAGRAVSSTDALGHTANFGFTESGSLSSISRPSAEHVLSNSLDTVRAQATAQFIDDEIIEGGTLSSVVDPLGRLRQVRKDASGMVLSITDFGQAGAALLNTGIVTTYTHNEQGQVTQETFTNGDFKTFSYDTNGNQIRVEWRRANNTLEQSQTKKYDRQNRLIAITDYRHTGNTQEVIYYQRFGYDIGGRRIWSFESHTRPANPQNIPADQKSHYIFDAAGRLVERRYPSTREITSSHNAVTAQLYTFDDFGRLCTIYARVDGREQILREYSYDAWGRVIETKTYPGFAYGSTHYISKRYTYDDFGQIASMKYFRSNNLNTPIESFVYTYNKNRQILTEHHISNHSNPPHDELRTYTYNENGRLIKSESTLTGVVEYGFDKVGNRRYINTNGSREISYYNGLDQIVRKTSNAGTVDFTHCNKGNLVREETRRANGSISNIREFSYTVDNRLTEARQGTTQANIRTVQTNTFRGDGQRITKQEDGITTNYVYRAGQVLFTTCELGQRRAFNLYSPAGNIIAARQYCSSSHFQDMYVTYLSDSRGSIASIIDDSSNFIQGYRYTDYGITTRVGSGAFNEFAYTQGIWDELTGLYYLNARFYNPVDGRFMTQDPYRGSNDQPDTWHLYGYCAGDPINFIDPSGNRMVVRGSARNRTLLRNHLQRLTRIRLTLHLGSRSDERVVRRNTLQRLPGHALPRGNELIRRVINHNRTVTIRRTSGQSGIGGNNWANQSILFNPNEIGLVPTRINSSTIGWRSTPARIILAHELIHADRAFRGRFTPFMHGSEWFTMQGTVWWQWVMREELATIGLRHTGTGNITENQIRREHNLRRRAGY